MSVPYLRGWAARANVFNMEPFKRLFRSGNWVTRNDVLKDRAYEALEMAENMLSTQFELGGALRNEENRQRLGRPYARGYIFGFIEAALQRVGVTDEIQALALMAEAHTKLFGVDIGSSLLGQSMSDQALDSIFTQGREAGAADLLRWIADTSERPVPPFMLADYLNGTDVVADAE